MAAWIACHDCNKYLVRVYDPRPSRVRCQACQEHYDTHEGVVHERILAHFYALVCSCCGEAKFDPEADEERLLDLIEAYQEDDPTASVEALCVDISEELGGGEDGDLCAYCDHVWNTD